MQRSKGFTLIELLVVIAIIGVLSSIVLSALNNARNKGGDAAVKANLDGARVQAELFYDANNNKYYGGTALTNVCDSTASVGSPAVKGIYPSVLGAAQAAGLSSVNNAIGTQGALDKATCHACTKGQGSTNCTTEDKWAAEAPLKAGNLYCVDSSGTAVVTATFLGAGDAVCG